MILTFISEDFYFLSHRKDLLIGLRELGFKFSLATNLEAQSAKVLETGIPVYPVNLHRKSLSPLSVIRGAFRYRRIIEVSRPEILFAVALKPILAATICRFLGARQPILCAFAGLGGAFAGNARNVAIAAARWGMERVFKPLLNHERCYCLFQNFDDAELFWQRGWTTRERSFVINGAGVELNDYLPKKWDRSGPVTFLFVGRLLWDKGISELVQACQLLKRKGISFKCRIAGLIDSTNKAAVPLDFIEEQHRLGIIEWLGPRSDVPALLNSADCFVFPSIYREGVPKVLLEASAAGLPIITTDMPGCRDVVKNGLNGFVVPPKDYVKLAESMEYCVLNRGKLPEWGANARRKAESEYRIEEVIKRHVEIFKTIALRHNLPQPCDSSSVDEVVARQ
jgi:glycosyltransferase involved in cell wall biosynthesis